jgi:hypothetical protein
MFELQDLWAKAYLRQGGQWGWFLCTDPDDPWGSQVLASTDDPRQCFRKQEDARRVAVSWARHRGCLKGVLP